MKRASTATTRTHRSPGIHDLNQVKGRSDATVRRRPPRICLVVACSQRKRLPAPRELQLASIVSVPEERVAEWRKRLQQVDAPYKRAEDLYVGDHWHSAREAYRLTRRYSGRTELWVISAGYGLIPASKLIKPYSATFATRAADSVWRGMSDGDRRKRLQQWWSALPHERSLSDLLAPKEDGAVVLVAGAAYLTAIDADLEKALDRGTSDERISIISAGTRRNDVCLPVSGRFREALRGTDSALNARLLALLAREAEVHRFDRSAMAAMLNGMASHSPATTRSTGTPLSDEQVADRVRAIRRALPDISRTKALRALRGSGLACEQKRFASIWDSVVHEQLAE